MTTETNTSRPAHRVFAVIKNGKKKFWQPIGALWAHADGKGFNFSLDYLPISAPLRPTATEALNEPLYRQRRKGRVRRRGPQGVHVPHAL